MTVFDELTREDQKSTFSLKRKKSHGTIIKSKDIRIKSTKIINPLENSHIPASKGKITPLTEAGEVIGFIYQCSCGEIAKVIFDYDEPIE
ncbi:MAG: hypothetical protein D6677_03535 [Calditrichaeota bacterium]|nr:MAG: hypothetical protein D6677_03535 [Calditrichota bacterium]